MILSARLLFNDTYAWDGWGGKLRLGSGKCRMRIFDTGSGSGEITPLKPYVVIVSDICPYAHIPSRMTVKSCASHIASNVVRDFDIDPQRMLWVEYYPASGNNLADERFDAAEFVWEGNSAISPKWRELSPFYRKIIQRLLDKTPDDITA